MISLQKLKLLHVARRELDMPELAYREILRHHGGVESSKDLDDEGFARVLDCLKALGFWVQRKFEQQRPRDSGDLPTPDQLKVIEHLWSDLTEFVPGAIDGKFRQGFYKKRLKIPALGPQTRAQANAVIEALKARVTRELKRRSSASPARNPNTVSSPQKRP